MTKIVSSPIFIPRLMNQDRVATEIGKLPASLMTANIAAHYKNLAIIVKLINYKCSCASCGGKMPNDYASKKLHFLHRRLGAMKKMAGLSRNEIADGIFIDTNQCCQTHFDERLKKDGITCGHFIGRRPPRCPVRSRFLCLEPAKNYTAPKPEQLEFGVSVLEKLISAGKKIYEHCKNGYRRAPTLVAAYLIQKDENPEEAEALIKSKRPSIHLEEVQR